MVSSQLIDYIKTRFSEGRSVEDILNELKLQEGFNEQEFREAINMIQNPNSATSSRTKPNSTIYMYSLLAGSIIVIMFGMSSFNATRSKFPNLLSFIMLIASLLIFIGEEKLKIIWQKMQEAKKDSKRRM